MFKLCPPVPTDNMMDRCKDNDTKHMLASERIVSNYIAMTAECQTVEIVDAKDMRNGDWMDLSTREQGIWEHCLDHLTQNGYKIIKVKDDETK